MTENPFRKAVDEAKARGDSPAHIRNIRLYGQAVSRLLSTILTAGYQVRIHDGEDWNGGWTDDLVTAVSRCWTTDEDRIYIRDKSNVRIGWVYLVYGNDVTDLVSDFGGQNLEFVDTIIRPALNYIEDL